MLFLSAIGLIVVAANRIVKSKLNNVKGFQYKNAIANIKKNYQNQ